MPESGDIPFAKFHGLHNDFIVVRARDLPRAQAPLARAITNRHTGVGADGLLVLSAPRRGSNHARLRIYNADGSEAEMSGNGIRCAAAFLVDGKNRAQPLRIETLAGVRSLEPVRASADHRSGHWTFKVEMGEPVFDPRRIPFRAGKPHFPVVGFPLSTGLGPVAATVTSMGNPHCSIFVEDFLSLDWRQLGREIERHGLFPRRTNVEFVRVVSRSEIEVRYWERGVGETVSSGTGSCAAAVAAILNGRTEARVRVRTAAGSLLVEWPGGGQVLLTGPADFVARGNFAYRPRRPR